MGPITELFYLVRCQQWPEFVELLRKHPQEGLTVVKGKTLLIFICSSYPPPPLDVIQTYLELQPSSVKILSRRRRSPLLLACRESFPVEFITALACADPNSILVQDYRKNNVFHICGAFPVSEETLFTLLSIAGPEISREALLQVNEHGKAPVHLALQSNSPMTQSEFEALVKATPIDELSLSPLEALDSEIRRFLETAVDKLPPPSTPVSTKDPTQYCNPEQSVSVERMWMWRPGDSLILWKSLKRALCILGFDKDNMSTYPLLHACMEQDPRSETYMFECIVSLNPLYVCQARVSDGALPLHLAARMATDSDAWLKRIELLVRLYPKGASVPDCDGRLPLELLFSSGGPVSWAQARTLISAYPIAITRLELPESFYPRLLSRLMDSGSADAAYQILLETPTLI